MITEIRFVNDFPSYAVTRDGRIWSFKSKGWLKPKIRKDKYKSVSLSNEGKRKGFYVHRIVASAFLPNPLNFPVVNHIDGDKGNNNVENLEWCTNSHNTIHAYETDLITPFKRKVRCIETDQIYESIEMAASVSGAQKGHICSVCRGRRPNAGGYRWEYVN